MHTNSRGPQCRPTSQTCEYMCNVHVPECLFIERRIAIYIPTLKIKSRKVCIEDRVHGCKERMSSIVVGVHGPV